MRKRKHRIPQDLDDPKAEDVQEHHKGLLLESKEFQNVPLYCRIPEADVRVDSTNVVGSKLSPIRSEGS